MDSKTNAKVAGLANVNTKRSDNLYSIIDGGGLGGNSSKSLPDVPTDPYERRSEDRRKPVVKGAVELSKDAQIENLIGELSDSNKHVEHLREELVDAKKRKDQSLTSRASASAQVVQLVVDLREIERQYRHAMENIQSATVVVNDVLTSGTSVLLSENNQNGSLFIEAHELVTETLSQLTGTY